MRGGGSGGGKAMPWRPALTRVEYESPPSRAWRNYMFGIGSAICFLRQYAAWSRWEFIRSRADAKPETNPRDGVKDARKFGTPLKNARQRRIESRPLFEARRRRQPHAVFRFSTDRHLDTRLPCSLRKFYIESKKIRPGPRSSE